MSFRNNNNNNDQPTTIVYTPISFANPEFNEGSRFSVSYFNRLLKVSIAKKNGTNGEFATYDNDNASVMYLSHMKAKILYELIQQMKTDDTIHNVCVETNKGLFIVSDGQEFDSNTPCFVIKSADNNGNISSVIYQTKNNYNGAINYSDDGYTDRLIEGVELETFENVLLQYFNASTYAIAASVMEASAYKYNAIRSNITAIAEKVGASTKGGGYSNKSSFLNNNNSSNSGSPSFNDGIDGLSSDEYESASFDDVVNSMKY